MWIVVSVLDKAQGKTYAMCFQDNECFAYSQFLLIDMILTEVLSLDWERMLGES